jgi:3D (Asp-Asp-Asp) domain-containing protein
VAFEILEKKRKEKKRKENIISEAYNKRCKGSPGNGANLRQNDSADKACVAGVHFD